MRFKVDENLPVDVAVYLRAAGHDAVTVGEQTMMGEADELLAEVCGREGRAFVTLDMDFADIRTYPPEQYAGFIVLRPGRQDKQHVMHVFGRAMPLLALESLEKRLWIVDEHSVRMRAGNEEGDQVNTEL